MDEKIIIKGKLANIKKTCILISCMGLIVFGIVFSIVYPPLGFGLHPSGIPIIVPRYLAFTFLPYVVIAVVFYLSAKKIQLTVTDKRVYGTAVFGKRVDIPLDKISAVGTGAFKGISVTSSSGAIKFTMISNNNEIHAEISKLLLERQEKKDATATTAPTASSPAVSNADELKKYKDLLDSGIITQEEFDAKKKQLLGL